ncbi:hypothetical protein N0V83_007583 [Neocucurbitaria cava]|uniref:Uncharacterized protein n=1 Tax=Neocucurbitaria cava TaxID=798079 RepID=A0A9W8Y447_9PLEO|nr:hypothetical protein N0V83_007583 [Neocucurbitaria cava]
MRPRATWAQIVQAFNITNPSSLVEAYHDSDRIPSAIDVPIQRVRLFDLAQLALWLGCTKVEVNTEGRYLRATGPVCTLKTEEIPTFGNAIRFEGDLAALMDRDLGAHDAATVLVADRICQGRFLSGIHVGELKAFRTHFDILCFCLGNKWSSKRYYEALQSAWPPRSVELERRIYGFADEIETLNVIQARLLLPDALLPKIPGAYKKLLVSEFDFGSNYNDCGYSHGENNLDQVSPAAGDLVSPYCVISGDQLGVLTQH